MMNDQAINLGKMDYYEYWPSTRIIKKIGRRWGYQEFESTDSDTMIFKHENQYGCGGRKSSVKFKHVIHLLIFV